MRFSAIIPILLSATAFVLSFLVLFAGHNENFLTDTYIIKLNTTNIGNGTINIPNTGISVIDNLTHDTINSIVQSTAKKLGIHDFYNAEVMGYCEGTLNATGNGDQTEDVVTNCTSKTMFTFDPVTILQNELALSGLGITLDDIGFPTADVNKAVHALNVAYKAMFITYCIGIMAAGICFFLGFLGFFSSRFTACVNWMFAFLSFIALGLASGIATALAVKLRDIINSKLRDIGITASYSSKFLGLTWAAVLAMLIVSLYWCCACCSGRNDGHKRTTNRNVSDESGLVSEKPPMRRRWRR